MPDIEKLKEIIKELQKIMRIQDWDIDIELLTTGEMIIKYPDDATCNTNGMSYRNIRRNCALVSINKENPENWYDTLVHELFHVQETIYIHAAEAYMSDNGSYFEDIHEGYIDKLTSMFVSIYPVTNFITRIWLSAACYDGCASRVIRVASP